MFLTRRSTYMVTILRLILIILPHVLPFDTLFPSNWLYSTSFTSVLIRPHQTLSHVREARAIQQLSGGRFADAYNAHSSIRLPPLVLAAITPVLDLPIPELWLSFFLLVIDFLVAYMIETIGRQVLLSPNPNIDNEEKEQRQLPEAIRPHNSHIFPIYRERSTESDPVPLLSMQSLPLLGAQLYYWSPFVAIPGGIYHCFQSLPAFFLVASLWESCQKNGSYSLACFYLAVASYIEPHHIVFLVPLTSFCQHNKSSSTNIQVMIILFFGIWSACLQGLSNSLVGPTKYWDVLATTYGCGWRNLSPSLSLQWYFHMQLFSRFRGYFGSILTGLPYILVTPLAIRFQKYPMVVVAALSLSWTIFRPVETLFDLNFSLCFLLFCPRSLARTSQVSFFSLCSLWVPVILNVVDHWMWLDPNTGNPNYMFFQCLAFNVFLGIILVPFCSASLQRDKALRLAAKERGTQGN